MMKKKTNEIMAAVMLLVGLGACSSGPKVQEFADTANASEEVQRFANDMQTAVDDQVDVLSPAAFRQADKALKAAIMAQQKREDRKDILHEVAKGRAQLDRANQFAKLSHTNMGEVVAARQAAIKSGARRSFTDDFNKADNHLRSVTSEIENNDLDDVAESRAGLQQEYLDLELKAIKQASLGSVRETISSAVNEGAKDYAKQSLAIAEKRANDTEAFIIANRHERDAISSRSEDAKKAALHLLKITRAAKAGQNISPEELALKLESEQNKTQEEKDRLQAEREKTKALVIEKMSLKSEQALNQALESARNEFTSDEAEVYRQGNRLVIRLRALEFPVNQSVIRGSNFPLLAKVANVMKGFENSTVVIEGHTDSDGSKALNKKLSTERAQAILEYLVSNEAVDESNITAVGYGFERPLASNKTVKGKAQNRRVDINISPETVEAE